MDKGRGFWLCWATAVRYGEDIGGLSVTTNGGIGAFGRSKERI